MTAFVTGFTCAGADMAVQRKHIESNILKRGRMSNLLVRNRKPAVCVVPERSIP